VNISTNPYQIGVAANPKLQQGDIDNQMKIYKSDDQQAIAPEIPSFPLENINAILSNVFVSMMQIRELIKQSENHPDACSEKIALVEDKIDQINKDILDLPTYLAIL
jgi:hypothetical protein